MLFFLLACSDYDLFGGVAPPSAVDEEQPGTVSVTRVGELCNGVDDDGDGAVDEGWADTDGDGVVDCADSACELESAIARPPEADSACERPLGDAAEMFAALEPEAICATYTDAWGNNGHMPLLAPVTDSDGDGDVDIGDKSWDVGRASDGELAVLDLESGTTLWRTWDDDGMFGASLCDADADGEMEVVAVQGEYSMAAEATVWTLLSRNSSDRRVRWVSPEAWEWVNVPVDLEIPECADLDGDGAPEIVVLNGIFRGADGVRLASFERPPAATGNWNLAVADVDLDGDQEVAVASMLRDSDGTILWDLDLGAAVSWVMMVQGDDDDEAELLMATSDGLFLVDTDGEVLAYEAADFSEVNYQTPAKPCAADLDGDGRQDFVVARGGELRAWDRDLVELWSAPADPLAGGSACMAWDADDDGAYEVLNSDGETFTVYDGRTGTVIFQDTGRYEASGWSSPLVADIDRDGSAEIVVTSMVYHGDPAIKVWGHPDGLLPQGPLSWPVEQYHATNIGPMGEVPSTPPHYWLDNGGLFRGYPAGAHPGADIVGEVTDVCQSSTWPAVGSVSVSGTVGNAGPKAAEAVVLTASGADGGVLASADLGTVDSGTSVAFELSFALAPACGGEVSITAATPTGQCDETNDRAVLPEPDCSGG